MVFIKLTSLALWLTLVVNLVQVVAGWAFGLPSGITEGANAVFRVTDDGGGFYYPYTMTVFKKVPNQPDQQVGLVYTNESTFYWDCNQPAGTVLQFRLVSKANVNAASSGNMTVQPGAQAAASSVSVQSVLSMASLFSQTAAGQATQTGSSLPSASGTPLSGGTEVPKAKGVSTGVIVGISIAGAVLLMVLLLVAWRVYRHKSPKGTQELVHHDDTITPFTQSQSHQYVPPMGYVDAYTHPYEEPPQYAPPSESTNVWSPSNPTTYSSTYASTSSELGATGGMSERDGRYGPVRNEKRRHLPGGTVQR